MSSTSDTENVLNDIRFERYSQIDDGWTPDHDDRHDTHTLVQLAEQYAHKPGDLGPGYYDRRRLVQAAALLVAAIEAMDRRDRS